MINYDDRKLDNPGARQSYKRIKLVSTPNSIRTTSYAFDVFGCVRARITPKHIVFVSLYSHVKGRKVHIHFEAPVLSINHDLPLSASSSLSRPDRTTSQLPDNEQNILWKTTDEKRNFTFVFESSATSTMPSLAGSLSS